MPQNPFDKASRYAAKFAPPAFFAWSTGLPADRLAFLGWLDTRAVPFPGAADRTGDTVARIEDPSSGRPWAVAVEFQIEPDPLVFGRLLCYLGRLWLALKPDPERGSRFNVGAVVLNLTGTGSAARAMHWPQAGFSTELVALERNLASENADDLLIGVESGRWGRGVLPWLPLMTGGADPGIIDRWKKAAEAEPDFRLKANYAGLARVFASAAKRTAVWDQALKGWNVIESEVVNEWIAEGRVEGRVEEAVTLLIAVLEAKFGTVPPEAEAKVRGTSDLVQLQEWVTRAAKAATLDEFRTATGV